MRQRLTRYISSLVVFPGLGRVRDDTTPDIRGHESSEHVIVDYSTDNELIVVRIMHRKMDIAGMFDQDFS